MELTERQEQCLRLTATMTDKEIARELGISPHTVNMHIRNAMEKLGVSSRGKALRAITENSLRDLGAMDTTSEPLPPRPVVEPEAPRCPADAEDPNKYWYLLPTYVAGPPRSKLSRSLLILGMAFVFLAVGASLVGLFGVLVDGLDRWAVDPTQSLREE